MSKELNSHLIIILATFLVGGSFVVSQKLSGIIDPISITLLRFVIASLVLVPIIFFNQNYRKKLVFLDGLKRNCTQQKSFERLKNTNLEMYSIRILGDLNVRILFTFKSINKIEHAILLCVFLEKEKGNKVNSKDGYKVNIKIAEDRSKEIN